MSKRETERLVRAHQVWIDVAQRYFGPFRDKRLLVVGSGTGGLEVAILSSLNGEQIPRIISLDIDRSSIFSTARLLRSVSEDVCSTCLQADGHSIPLKNECADVVFCIAVLEHVRDYETFVREILRVLKPGGYLFLYYGPNARMPLDSPYHRGIVTRYLTPAQVRGILQPSLSWMKPVWAELIEYRLYRKAYGTSGHALYHKILTLCQELASVPILRWIVVRLLRCLERMDLQHGIAFVGQKHNL